MHVLVRELIIIALKTKSRFTFETAFLLLHCFQYKFQHSDESYLYRINLSFTIQIMLYTLRNPVIH